MATPQIRVNMHCTVEAILRRLARSQWCRRCHAIAEMIPACEAASLADTSLQIIFRWAEIGRVHFMSSRDGAWVVCGNSLQSETTTRKLATGASRRIRKQK